MLNHLAVRSDDLSYGLLGSPLKYWATRRRDIGDAISVIPYGLVNGPHLSGDWRSVYVQITAEHIARRAQRAQDLRCFSEDLQDALAERINKCRNKGPGCLLIEPLRGAHPDGCSCLAEKLILIEIDDRGGKTDTTAMSVAINKFVQSRKVNLFHRDGVSTSLKCHHLPVRREAATRIASDAKMDRLFFW